MRLGKWQSGSTNRRAMISQLISRTRVIGAPVQVFSRSA
jgi:hypothetical protein